MLQYTSAKLARQLGVDDRDGHVGIMFRSESATYNPAAVKVIEIDLFDRLGDDSRGC